VEHCVAVAEDSAVGGHQPVASVVETWGKANHGFEWDDPWLVKDPKAPAVP